MKKSKRLWRALLFSILLAALCGSLALPIVGMSVYAAPQMQAATDIVISEFRFRGSGGAADEFVEVFNPTAIAINLNGWKLNGSNNAGATNTRYTFTTDVLLQPGQHYLLANSNPIDGVAADATYGTGITADGGVALLRPDNSIADAVGLSTGSAYKEGTALSSLTTDVDQSYERNLDVSGSCIDSNNNASDFYLRNPSDPQNSSSPLTICGNPTQTPSPTSSPLPTGTSSPVRSVIINEIAWAGTAAASNDEWFELYNNTGADVNLTGWHLVADDGNPDIALSGTITAADPYFVFAKSNSVFSDLVPDKTFSGSFSNNGEILYLLDPNGNQVDTANLDGGAWPAGSASPNFASMERLGTVIDGPSAWATYGGTVPIAHDRNGNGIKGTPGQKNWVSSITATPSPTLTGTPTKTGTPGTSLSVLINEVAWSGTAANSSDEWIELHNTTSLPIDITGWKLYGDDNTLNKTGSPNIVLKGIIPAKGYFLLERDELATDVPSNQVYSGGDLLNTGERLYLKDNSGKTIDTGNLDGGAWPAGTASTTTTSPPAYASMERVGTTGNVWVTYQGTVPVAFNRNGGPIKGTPGEANWINTASVTTITSDLPDPSVVNANVTVRVTVVGGTSTATGTVTVSATSSSNCTITLVAGAGSCTLKFTSVGSKTITATYRSTSGLPPSNDTESHQVVTSGTVYKTPTPIPPPPPQLVVINEFVPRPGHDWNHDGVVNTGDEYIELLNHGTVDVNLSGWRLDDEVNVGSDPFSLPAKTIKPGERIVFYGSDTGLLLGDGGDAVRLLKPNGQLIDAYNYTIARYPDESFCRLPDNGGADDWNQFCFPTPGIQNSLSGNFASPPSPNVSEQPGCPISDTLPPDFVQAECDPFGKNIWSPEFWDSTGWYDQKNLPASNGKWPVFAD